MESPSTVFWSVLLVLALSGWAGGERTVVVTPRPRWLVKDQRSDSVLPRVPVISLRVLHPNPESVISAALPMEHRGKAMAVDEGRRPLVPLPMARPLRPLILLRPSYPNYPATPVYRVAPQPPRETVLVESVPSLSLQLDEEEPKKERYQLPDYLTPPRFPSVYEKMEDKPSQETEKSLENENRFDTTSSIDETSNEIPDSIGLDFGKKAPKDRVEFQMHGQAGPESYKFGFDTGAGKNRQFRYEEKDAVGNVIGHFGYYDNTGKLQIFKYKADKNGFQAVQVD